MLSSPVVRFAVTSTKLPTDTSPTAPEVSETAPAKSMPVSRLQANPLAGKGPMKGMPNPLLARKKPAAPIEATAATAPAEAPTVQTEIVEAGMFA